MLGRETENREWEEVEKSGNKEKRKAGWEVKRWREGRIKRITEMM